MMNTSTVDVCSRLSHGSMRAAPSDVAMAWPGWAPGSLPDEKKSKIISPLLAVKIRTSGYQTLERFIATLPT